MSRAAGIGLAGAILIMAAFTFDSSGLFVPGAAFVLLGLLTPPWIALAARGTRVSRVLHADRVVEGQPLEATIEIRRGSLGAPGVQVIDPLAGGTVPLGRWVSPFSASRTTQAKIVARFPRRGRRRFAPPALAFSDPLGLVQIVRSGTSTTEELLVLPRTERLRWVAREPGLRLDSSAPSASMEAMAATDVDGLRPYQRGTPASRISWPSLARGAGLLERRLRVERDSGPIVVLDARCSGLPEQVDAAVRATASLTLELARRTGCDLLLPGERRPVHVDHDLGAWPGAHALLAVVEGGPDAPAPWLETKLRLGWVFYVAAERDRLPARLGRGDQAAAMLVLPQNLTPAAGRMVFEVSGCRGYLVGASARRPGARERAA